MIIRIGMISILICNAYLWLLLYVLNTRNKFHIFFTSSSAEFQEAFNLFDNRGDGKIQLNQVSYIQLNFKTHNPITISQIFPFRSANAFEPLAKTRPSRTSRNARSSSRPTIAFRSRSFCPSTRRFRRLVPVTRPTISSKVCDTLTRTPVVSFRPPNCVICWRRSVRSWPTTRWSSCWSTRRIRRATLTTRNSYGSSWTDRAGAPDYCGNSSINLCYGNFSRTFGTIIVLN